MYAEKIFKIKIELHTRNYFKKSVNPNNLKVSINANWYLMTLEALWRENDGLEEKLPKILIYRLLNTCTTEMVDSKAVDNI